MRAAGRSAISELHGLLCVQPRGRPQGASARHHDQSRTPQGFSTTNATPKAPQTPTPRFGELEFSGMGTLAFGVETQRAASPGEVMSATALSCSGLLSRARAP